MLMHCVQRNFRLISVLGFTAVLMCTWEAILLYVHKPYMLNAITETWAQHR